ncbi:MAG TPA: PAS domain S-box protein [Trichocoleus sp.]
MNFGVRQEISRHWQVRYGLPAVTTVVSLLVRLSLIPVWGLAGPFLLFAPAIMLSAWVGGLRPGLVATGLSCLLADYFLLVPLYSLKIADSSDLIRLVLFAAIGIQISVLSGKLLSAKWQAEASARRANAAVCSLERSEERYRLLVEKIKDYAIFALDTTGHVASWNSGAEQIKGYQPLEILGRHFSCFYRPEDIQGNKPQYVLEQAILNGRFCEENWQVRKDGSQFWARTVLTPIHDNQGNLRGFTKVTQDMTERKQAEEQLRQTIKDLSDMKFALDQAAIVATTDPQGVIRYVNDKFCQISQYSQEELIGQDHRILNSGHHPKSFFRNLWSTIQAGQTWDGEIKNRAKDGSYYWVSTTIVPFLDENGKPIQYLAIRFDITQQKQAEAELQQLNNSLEDLVEERTAELQQSLAFEATLKRITDKVRDSLDESQILQAAVNELGTSLGVDACNAALYDLEHNTATICYEYQASSVTMKGRVAQITRYPEIYQPLLGGQYLQFCNIIANPLRGRVAMLACPIIDDQGVLGDLWLVANKEYTFKEVELRLVQQVANQCAIALRQAHLYQAAQAQVQALEQLNWLKDDFLSTVSHELRTPVSNIKMSIRMLEIALKNDENLNGSREKVTQYMQILKTECEREISLINDLLDLQRLEAGKRTLSFESIKIEHWLPKVVQPFLERAESRQQALEIKLPTQDLPALVSDLPGLERILAELLNNACKYTPPGETITVSANAEREAIQLIVSNSGIEIPASELALVFDKFYRVPNADPWKQGGTGLGLALVQKLAQHLGGNVQVQSGNNQTTFTVEIANHSSQLPTYQASES